MEELTITIKIADRPYRLNIKKEEEEYFRKASDIVNKSLMDYQNNFAFKDRQDLLAMIALESTFKNLSVENEIKENEKIISSKLVDLDKILTFEK